MGVRAWRLGRSCSACFRRSCPERQRHTRWPKKSGFGSGERRALCSPVRNKAFRRPAFLETICIGLGVNPDHVKVITPLPQKHAENVETIAAELKYEGLSVIVSRRECIQTLRRKK